MFHKKLFVPSLLAALAVGAVIGSLAVGDPAKEKPADKPEFKLPPGWTEADMQAFAAAATPGKNHEFLAKSVGTWQGKNTMWMYPGADPVTSDSTLTITSLLDGRYIQAEWKGEVPGMGPFTGLHIVGYDNVAQKFVSTWIDSHSTGMMHGEGELSKDGKTLTWKFEYMCPLTKKPAVMREIETFTGANARTFEMFGADPKSGKEFKMMSIELKKK